MIHRLYVKFLLKKKISHKFKVTIKNEEYLSCAHFVCCGDFYYGTLVRNIQRFRSYCLPFESKQKLRDHGSVLGGKDGSIGYMLPVTESIFQLLKNLSSHLVRAIEHTAGLHPFAFRLTKPIYHMGHPHHRTILDGDLIWKFLNLERNKQDELANVVKSSTNQIINILFQFCVQSSFL